jgi:hypothetical protein
MNGAHFANKTTGHSKVLMVAELTSSVPCKTTASVLPSERIRNNPLPYYTKAMINDYEVSVVTRTENNSLHN